jgi:hypothetical protein
LPGLLHFSAASALCRPAFTIDDFALVNLGKRLVKAQREAVGATVEIK